jgi:aminoglycoside phosphotransferase (APT) family kinase protein
MSFQDPSKPVRKGEELAVDPLRPYLEESLGEPISALTVTQFPGGYSNLTYLLHWSQKDGGQRSVVLRRPPFGSTVKRAHDMGREHRILTQLAPHLSWVPRPLAFCQDHAVLGADFYVMERVAGVILRREVPSGVTVDPATARRMSEILLDTLVELHALDYDAIGLGDLGKPEGYVERQIRGWIRRYGDAQTDEVEQMPAVAAWLVANLPTSGPATIIHNDHKFDNVIWESERFEQLIGVLDWEMATLGDPLMDLGTTLCYWIEARDHAGLQNMSFAPTHLPGMLTRRQLCDRYADRTGRDVSKIVFYYVYGLYKTAVVVQQIYYRFKQGLTQDPRFAGLIFAVGLLADRAAETIERQEL